MVGFFILNYNDSKRSLTLAYKVASIKQIDFVYIFDNNSSKEEVDLLKFAEPKDKLYFEFSDKNLGYNKGTNYGLKQCEKFNPDFMFVANSDVDFTEDIVWKLLNVIIHNNKIGVLSCSMREHGENILNYYDFPSVPYICSCLSGLEHFIRKIRKVKAKEISRNLVQVDFVRNSLILLNYNVCNEVGFYDEDLFLYFGESSLALKLMEKGFVECLSLDCFYDHNHIRTKKSRVLSHKIYYKDIKIYCAKYKKINFISKTFINCSYILGFIVKGVLK